MQISYGKSSVSFYRTYAAPLAGVSRIPESEFAGRNNILFAGEVDVEVFGQQFLPAYTEGDNRNVVATDTMKNFILKEALNYTGATLEGFLYFLGERFLATYSHMESLKLTGREQPFDAARVPGSGDIEAFEGSNTLFSRSRNDYGYAVLEMARDNGTAIVTAHRCGRAEMQLIKITGSSFASFARDEYTTLPERPDRPLFIYVDTGWRYTDSEVMLGIDHAQYVPSEQVRDLAQAVFHSFVSMSIQHLLYEMGNRILERFPQLSEVSFEAQNRLWDTAFTDESDGRVKVYTDPRPPYGLIKLTMLRDEGQS